MTDKELLAKGKRFCRKHVDNDGCCNNDCPFYNNICINKNGKITLPNGKKMLFLDFTEQFRYMVRILSNEGMGFEFVGSKNDIYDTEDLLVGDLTCIDGRVYFWNGENFCELCDYATRDDYTANEPFRETKGD